MAIPWKVTWNKHIISYREKQPLDSLPWLNAHLTSSPPPSITKCSTSHRKDKEVSFILSRDHCYLLPSFPGCICAAVISQNTSSWLLHWVAETWPISTPLQPWPQPLGSPQFCQKQIFFFNYTPLLWMMPTSIHSFHSMSIILEIAWLEYILQVYIYICIYIFFSLPFLQILYWLSLALKLRYFW